MAIREGIYRRRIRITTAPGTARADLEDDPHRYGVVIRHDGGRVTAIEGIPVRTPWSLCPDAAAALQRLVGMPLAPSPTAVYRHTPGSGQCTHMFDMAGLAVAHAARGTAARQYDIAVPVRARAGPREVTLYRDGGAVLTWVQDGDRIVAPQPFAGRDVRRLLKWAEAELADADAYEAVVVLRRALHISNSRLYDLDMAGDAAAIDDGQLMGACYVYQPGVASRARRVVGSTREFTGAPELLLADLDAPHSGR